MGVRGREEDECVCMCVHVWWLVARGMERVLAAYKG